MAGSDELLERLYRWWIGTALTRAFRRADTEIAEIRELRAVIFSDHHRGRQDRADDFRRCENAYRAALGWYAEQGWALWLLGDVEELWENSSAEVIGAYAPVLALEAEFDRGRLWRIWGNHDMLWRRRRQVEDQLVDHLPPGTSVREGIRVELSDRGAPVGTLFLVHGHQGTLDSVTLLMTAISLFVVREIWARLQRMQGFASTAPSTDTGLRERHDLAMFALAKRRAARTGELVMLIAGHTHRPVFPTDPPPDLRLKVERRHGDLERARKQGGEVAARARAEYELARTR